MRRNVYNRPETFGATYSPKIDTELTLRRAQADLATAQRALVDAKVELERLRREQQPLRRVVRVSLIGTLNKYSYFVPDGMPMPFKGEHVAVPAVANVSAEPWQIAKVTTPPTKAEASHATKYCRPLKWSVE